MNKFLLSLLLVFAAAIDAQTKRDYPIQSVPFTNVQVADSFWTPRLETNRTITIPASFRQCETTGRVSNFVMAANRSGKFCTRYSFDDTDIYKTIEGASYTLSTHPDKDLDAYVDSMITLIGKAQESDGYLFTERTIDPIHTSNRIGPERWVNERKHSHELYNAGHLYEAAAAHYLATGKRSLLNIAIRNADLVASVFGPDKKHVAPGHQVIEMGLVKLYRVTGNDTYLKLAKFFLDERGHFPYEPGTSKDVFATGAYWQDHKPVTQQDEAVGHAVRAVYMYSGMADVAALTGDTSYIKAIDRLWESVVNKKIYVTGGIGAAGDGERFGENYELSNLTAYCETCASIGNVFWNYRMFLLHGDAKYIDVLEKTLYNALLSGVGMDGKSFFYTNALQIRNGFKHPDLEMQRSGWFECSCCPTNVTRLMPSIPGYIYAQKNDTVYVNLFIGSSASFELGSKKKLTISQQTEYPKNGQVILHIDPAASQRFTLRIRIPGWAQNRAMPGDLYTFADSSSEPVTLKINGQTVRYTVNLGYAVIERNWKKGDLVTLELPMPVRRVISNSECRDDRGKVSLQRGPLVYCAEGVDNEGNTNNAILPDVCKFETRAARINSRPIVTIRGSVPSIMIDPNGLSAKTLEKNFMAIPYYAWAHRGPGEMNIWFPRKIKSIDVLTE